MMKLFLRPFFGKPAKTAEPKRERRNLSAVLLDKLLSLPLAALSSKWTAELWKPFF